MRLTMFLVLALASLASHAQSWPAKPVRMIVPYAAGGTTDVLARIMSERLGHALGQPFVIEYRPGAGGTIGAEAAAKSAPDGYTIVMGAPGSHSTAASLYAKLGFDPVKDFAPIVHVANVPNSVVVHPSMPVKSIPELIAYVKGKPGEVAFGSAGTGATTHLTGELFALETGTKLTHVPYKGSSQALTDLLGGQIQAMFENLPTLPPHIAAGKLRALGVTSKTRAAALPDVPTVAESGVPGYESTAWFTVAAPAKVPAEIIRKLNADINAFIHAPDLQPRLKEIGVTPVGGSPEAAAKYFAAETEKWNGVIRAARIKAD